MKKKILFLIFSILILTGCENNDLRCSINLNEDGALTYNNVLYKFNFFGKQISRKETTNITFENIEDYNYYFEHAEKIYNNNNDDNLNYNFSKDDEFLSIKIERNLTNKNLSKKSLKTLDPKYNLNRKKIKKEYEEKGYSCN